MTDATALGALVERCEAASGPDRELDAAIRDAAEVHPRFVYARYYTSNINVAMTLLPANSLWTAGSDIDGPYARVLPPVQDGWLGSAQQSVLAATPALALCAAALRARATQEPA